MEKRTIGSFISVLRRAAGMTQRDLAEQLNVSDKTVSRWEREESAPDLTLLPVIADLFGITVDELLCGQRKQTAGGSAATENAGGEGTPPPTASNTKRQKMLFGNRLRKQKMLNYISLGLVAAGWIAALLCNSAFYRAALAFFLGLMFEVAAVICALAFGSAAMPVSEDDYDAALLQNYKKGVIRTAYLPIFLAALTLPLLLVLLYIWVEYGAYVASAGGMLAAALLITLVLAPLLHEVATVGVLPAIARRCGVRESEREAERRARIKRLAKKCALCAAAAMLLPAIALAVLGGTIDPDTTFVKGKTFDKYDDFVAYAAQEGKYGTTADWSEEDFGGILISFPRPPHGPVEVEVEVEPIRPPSEKDEKIDPVSPSNEWQHQVIRDIDDNIIAEFDWINADIARIDWSFDENADGTPITVYTYDDCIRSHSTYNVLVSAAIALLVAIPVSAAIVYGVKRRKV